MKTIMPHLLAASLQMKLENKIKGTLVMHQQWSCDAVERKKKKENCIRTAPAASALMKLKKEKYRIANEPTATPLVRLEKKKTPIANAAVAYLQVKEKKKQGCTIKGWKGVYHQND
jgi:hypothetical protein